MATQPQNNIQTRMYDQQQMAPYLDVSNSPDQPIPAVAQTRKRKLTRLIAIGVVVALVLIFYFIWHTSSPSPSTSTVTQQNFSATTKTNGTLAAGSTGGSIQVYIVGAVKHPGVYTLATGARVYQLLQAAGGPLAKANLVAINLAAKLSDGQEVYVSAIGEVPPTYMGGVPGTGGGTTGANGQLVNINTASASDLVQQLHITNTTAQAIVNYRSQHGNFTSIDQLSQVVSRSIYDKIRSIITV